MSEQVKSQMDWAAWLLQTLVGFLIGSALGFSLATGKNFAMWAMDAEIEMAICFIAGIGLVMGTIATQFCDRAWLRVLSSYPPDEIEHNVASRIMSLVLGVVGVGLTIDAVLITMKVI